MKRYIILLLIIFPFLSNSQSITGTVFGNNDKGKEPLPGVNVVWEGTSEGTASKTDGSFKLNKKNEQHMLVFSFVGYEPKTVHVHDTDPLEVVLQPNLKLEEVTVIKKDRGTYLSVINPIQTENISSAELHKAACCNLAESFETNPSVDVSYSDAITGAKQIKLLGLHGTYSQLQVENMPTLRGLATTFGLTYIPGPWLESIQVSKGAASVLNGYESIAGQINAELKKPDSDEKLFLNTFANNEGRYEFNGNTNIRVKGDTLTTGIFVHASDMSKENDHNHDGFLDSPLSSTIEIANRWKYNSHKGLMAQAGVTLLSNDRMGGQVGASTNRPPSINDPYGVHIKNNRVDGFFKSGIVSHDNHRALAILTNFARHETESYYGLTPYNADETRFYGNLVYTQDLDEAAIHVLNSGVSYIYDDFNENLYDSNIQRTEKVPGVFTEYTYKPNNKLTLMTGIRADFHNIFGNFVTPRMHFRYQFTDHYTIRASAGKGYRTANVISENSFLLSNSRHISYTNDAMQEKAWNYGFAFIQNYKLLGRDLSINAEFFHTDFQQKLVVDRETSSDFIFLLPSTEKAYANSLQFDVRWQPIERLDLLLAYRMNDIKETIGGELKKTPLTSDYKGLINLNYTTHLKKWMFDYTLQFNGGGRIPRVYEEWMNRAQIAGDFFEFSPYTIMNAQITKYFRYWNIYLGVENLTDFTQNNPIEGANDPFGPEFSATNIWGPTMGRKIYLGLRFTLNYE